MKTSRARIITLTLALVFALGSSMAVAKSKKHEDRPFPQPRMIEYLSLTPGQVSQLQTWHNMHHEEFGTQHDLVVKRFEKLNKAMKRKTPDTKLRELHADLQSSRATLQMMRFNKVLAVRGVLTPKQRKKFRGLIMHKSQKGGK